jgi:hypothetical protein
MVQSSSQEPLLQTNAFFAASEQCQFFMNFYPNCGVFITWSYHYKTISGIRAMHDFPKFELKTQDLLNFGPNYLQYIFFSNMCYDLFFNSSKLKAQISYWSKKQL